MAGNFFRKPINRKKSKKRWQPRYFNRLNRKFPLRGMNCTREFEIKVSRAWNVLLPPPPSFSPPPFLARQWYRLPKKNTRTTIPHWFSTSTPHAIVGAIVYTVSRPADFREESRIVSSKGEEEVAKGICRLLSLLNRRKTSLVPSACSQPPTAFISVSNLQAELYTQRSVSNYRVSSL